MDVLGMGETAQAGAAGHAPRHNPARHNPARHNAAGRNAGAVRQFDRKKEGRGFKPARPQKAREMGMAQS